MFRRFFSNPIVGFVGALASIISVMLAFYFYHNSQEKRDLTYYVHPIKAQIVKSNEASKLSVKYLENDIKSDVSAAQIAFWNRGNLSIKQSNILEPFTIKLDNHTSILEASIRKKSRDVIQLSLDQSMIQDGILRVNWDILEKNDGGIIQIIYAGNPELKIIAEGTIEGQHDISLQKFPGTFKSFNEQFLEYTKRNKQSGIVFVILGAFIFIFGMFLIYLKKKKTEYFTRFMGNIIKTGTAFIYFTIALGALYLFLGLYFLLTSRWEEPPFGM